MRVAVEARSGFKRNHESTANPAEPSIWRNVIEQDLAGVRNGAHRGERGAFGCDKERAIRAREPERDVRRRLVSKPASNDSRIVEVISPAKLSDRTPDHMRNGLSVGRERVTDQHRAISRQN
jgi:hypothetical protein